MTEQDYVAAVLEAYVALPDTACRPRRADRLLARRLFAEEVPREVVLDALLLSHARRHINPTSSPAPVRSLHYFLPVIRELAALDPDLRAMIRTSIQRHACHSAAPSPAEQTVSSAP